MFGKAQFYHHGEKSVKYHYKIKNKHDLWKQTKKQSPKSVSIYLLHINEKQVSRF